MAKILLIDDDEMVRELLAMRLEIMGHTPEQAGDGDEGFARLRDGGLDLIVLDMLMPKMDGIAFLKELGSLDAPAPPVLVLSATKIDAADLPRLPGQRVELLRKPASADAILAAVETILGAG